MLNKNYNSSCAFDEQIVSYIYDEASVKEKNEFESHLPNCLSCADEIAGFGLVRSSIIEWRKDEFFTLESPALKIPAMRQATLGQTVSSEKDSWFKEFRKLFSFSPAWAAGFAALIISIGLVWLFLGTTSNELASNKSLEISPVLPISANKNLTTQAEEKVSVKSPNEQINNVQKIDSTKKQESNPQRNQANKTATTTPKLKSVTPKINNSVAENSPVTNKSNKSNNVQKQTSPTLSGMSEEEDKSLRLAELFNEIDTK